MSFLVNSEKLWFSFHKMWFQDECPKTFGWLVGNTERKLPLGQGLRGRIILKWMLSNQYEVVDWIESVFKNCWDVTPSWLINSLDAKLFLYSHGHTVQSKYTMNCSTLPSFFRNVDSLFMTRYNITSWNTRIFCITSLIKFLKSKKLQDPQKL
jgi:hypothetical protein